MLSISSINFDHNGTEFIVYQGSLDENPGLGIWTRTHGREFNEFVRISRRDNVESLMAKAIELKIVHMGIALDDDERAGLRAAVKFLVAFEG